MTPIAFHDEGLKGRLPFILSLWMAIGVALLSALAPLGPPSSRLTGSAFNPATTSVVLKARAQATPVALRSAEPDGNRRTHQLSSAPAVLVAMAATLLIALWQLRPGQNLAWSAAEPRPSPPFSRHLARAPPASS